MLVKDSRLFPSIIEGPHLRIQDLAVDFEERLDNSISNSVVGILIP